MSFWHLTQKIPPDTRQVVDTVLAKLLARSEKTKELYALLEDPNHVFVPDLEPVLRETGQYNALCMLYKQSKNDDQLLEIWAKCVLDLLRVEFSEFYVGDDRIADGEWTDEDIKDPLSDMISLLFTTKDRALTQRWGIWLTKRDPDRAIKVRTLTFLRSCSRD
jgi:hypothetical protein